MPAPALYIWQISILITTERLRTRHPHDLPGCSRVVHDASCRYVRTLYNITIVNSDNANPKERRLIPTMSGKVADIWQKVGPPSEKKKSLAFLQATEFQEATPDVASIDRLRRTWG